MRTFFDSLLLLYASLPPGVWHHTASLLGTVAGLILFPADSWRAGLGQMFVGYLVSHFFVKPVATLSLFSSWPVETLRLTLGTFGFALAQGVAKVIRRFRDDPTGTLKDAVWGTIAEGWAKIKDTFKKS